MGDAVGVSNDCSAPEVPYSGTGPTSFGHNTTLQISLGSEHLRPLSCNGLMQIVLLLQGSQSS